MKKYVIGLSLGPTSVVESGVCVRELDTNKIVYLDKLFSMSDVQLFFDNYSSLKDSVICISLPWDNTMLEGKWRVLSKSYQLIHEKEDEFLNRNNWMQRFSNRGSELFCDLLQQGIELYRYEIYLARQSLNLYSNLKERSPSDCKFLQSSLKFEYDLCDLPSNMLPVAQLEAIVGTLVAEESQKGNCKKIFEFKGMNVINIK